MVLSCLNPGECSVEEGLDTYLEEAVCSLPLSL